MPTFIDKGTVPGYEHAAVHADTLVTATLVDSDVDVAAPLVVYIKPAPAGDQIHVYGTISADAACTMILYRNPSVTDEGTAFSHMRHNFTSKKTTVEQIFYAPVVVDNGSKVLEVAFGVDAAQPQARAGGGNSNEEEMVFGDDDSALIIITPAANDAQVNASFTYYEVNR